MKKSTFNIYTLAGEIVQQTGYLARIVCYPVTVHKNKYGNWAVSEPKTGMQMTVRDGHGTRREALRQARKRIKQSCTTMKSRGSFKATVLARLALTGNPNLNPELFV